MSFVRFMTVAKGESVDWFGRGVIPRSNSNSGYFSNQRNRFGYSITFGNITPFNALGLFPREELNEPASWV